MKRRPTVGPVPGSERDPGSGEREARHRPPLDEASAVFDERIGRAFARGGEIAPSRTLQSALRAIPDTERRRTLLAPWVVAGTMAMCGAVALVGYWMEFGLEGLPSRSGQVETSVEGDGDRSSRPGADATAAAGGGGEADGRPGGDGDSGRASGPDDRDVGAGSSRPGATARSGAASRGSAAPPAIGTRLADLPPELRRGTSPVPGTPAAGGARPSDPPSRRRSPETPPPAPAPTEEPTLEPEEPGTSGAPTPTPTVGDSGIAPAPTSTPPSTPDPIAPPGDPVPPPLPSPPPTEMPPGPGPGPRPTPGPEPTPLPTSVVPPIAPPETPTPGTPAPDPTGPPRDLPTATGTVTVTATITPTLTATPLWSPTPTPSGGSGGDAGSEVDLGSETGPDGGDEHGDGDGVGRRDRGAAAATGDRDEWAPGSLGLEFAPGVDRLADGSLARERAIERITRHDRPVSWRRVKPSHVRSLSIRRWSTRRPRSDRSAIVRWLS